MRQVSMRLTIPLLGISLGCSGEGGPDIAPAPPTQVSAVAPAKAVPGKKKFTTNRTMNTSSTAVSLPASERP